MTEPELRHARSPARPQRAARLAVVLALIVAGTLFHLPRLERPFGAADVNAGTYFGLFVKTYEDFGFADLRGLPLGPQRLTSPRQNVLPYLNHPPGMAWLFALLGDREAVFRAPTAVAAVLAAIALLLLLTPVTGLWPAALASLGLLGLPSLTIYSQASYETMVLAHGLWLWLATLRLERASGRGRLGWRAVQVLVSFTGPWADWSYVFFCAGLVPLTATTEVARWARRLAVPALVTGASTALIVAWRVWAMQCPAISAPPIDTSLGQMVHTTITARPPLADYLRLASRTMLAATSLPFAVAGVVGLVLLWRRSKPLALALPLAGLGQPLVFASHATDHVHFYCYTAAAMAGCAAALGTPRHRGTRIAGLLVLAGLAGHAWWKSAGVVHHSDTTFYRDLGRALTDATASRGPAGAPAKATRVVTNFPITYPYYVESPYVLIGSMVRVDPVLTSAQRNPELCYGYRYLWFRRLSGRTAEALVGGKSQLALDAFLEPFPRVRVPGLEATLHEPGIRLQLDAGDAWLVDVAPRFRIGVVHARGDEARARAVAAALAGRGLAIPFEAAQAVTPARLPAAMAGTLQRPTHLAILEGVRLAPGTPAAAGLRTVVEALLEHGAFVTAAKAAGRGLAEHPRLDTFESGTDPAELARAIVGSYERIALREDDEAKQGYPP